MSYLEVFCPLRWREHCQHSSSIPRSTFESLIPRNFELYTFFRDLFVCFNLGEKQLTGRARERKVTFLPIPIIPRKHHKYFSYRARRILTAKIYFNHWIMLWRFASSQMNSVFVSHPSTRRRQRGMLGGKKAPPAIARSHPIDGEDEDGRTEAHGKTLLCRDWIKAEGKKL